MSMKIRKRALSACAVVLVFINSLHSHVPPHAGQAQAINAQRKSSPIIYLALGDSTGIGVGARTGGGYVDRLFSRISGVRPESRLVNLCATAAATDDVLHGQMNRLAGVRPTLVTLGIGANDLIRGVKVGQFARNYEEIIVRLEMEVRAPVLIMNIPDLSLAPAVPAYMRDSARQHIIAFNKQIEDVARRHNLLLIDLYGRSREFSLHAEFFSADGAHPSAAGYEFWAEAMWPFVQKIINRQSK